jgi:hypothetical protein
MIKIAKVKSQILIDSFSNPLQENDVVTRTAQENWVNVLRAYKSAGLKQQPG